MLGLVLLVVSSSKFGLKVCWVTWVVCFGVVIAVLNCSSKLVSLLTWHVQTHEKLLCDTQLVPSAAFPGLVAPASARA